MRIEKAKQEDVDRIIDIWQSCFKETQVADLFYNEFSGIKSTTLIRQRGSIVSIMNLLPCNMLYKGKRFSGVLLYALGTSEEFRRLGYMSALLAHVKRMVQEGKFDFAFIEPESDHLRKYYIRNGFDKELSYVYRELSVIRKEEMEQVEWENFLVYYNLADKSDRMIEKQLCFENSIRAFIVEELRHSKFTEVCQLSKGKEKEFFLINHDKILWTSAPDYCAEKVTDRKVLLYSSRIELNELKEIKGLLPY